MEPAALKPWGVLHIDTTRCTPSERNGLVTKGTTTGSTTTTTTLTRIVLDQKPFHVGRNPTTNCIIQNPCISNVHCTLNCVFASSQSQHTAAARHSTVTVADLSSNGIYINGQRIGKGKTAILRDGDVLSLVKAQRQQHEVFDISYKFELFVETEAKKNVENDGEGPAIPPQPTGGFMTCASPGGDGGAPTGGVSSASNGVSYMSETAATKHPSVAVGGMVPVSPVGVGNNKQQLCLAAQFPAKPAQSGAAPSAIGAVPSSQPMESQDPGCDTSVSQRVPNPNAKVEVDDAEDEEVDNKDLVVAPQHAECSKQLEDDFQVFYDKCLGSGAFAHVYLAAPRKSKDSQPGGVSRNMVDLIVQAKIAVKVINKKRLHFQQQQNGNNGNQQSKSRSPGKGVKIGGGTSGQDAEEDVEEMLFEELNEVEQELQHITGRTSSGKKKNRQDSTRTSVSMAPHGFDVSALKSAQAVAAGGFVDLGDHNSPLAQSNPEAQAQSRRYMELFTRKEELLKSLGVPFEIFQDEKLRKVNDVIRRFEQFRKNRIRQKREIAILRAINHPNVISTLGVYETKEKLCFAMELAEGGELFSLIREHAYLPEYVVRSAAYQLLQGIAYLHSMGIVHRDIKLENLLLRHKYTLPRVGGNSNGPVDESVAAAQRSIASHKNYHDGLYNTPDNFSPLSQTPEGCYNGGQGASSRQIEDDLQQHALLHVMLADFGLSKMLHHVDTSIMSTMCGTPIYVAPEVTNHGLRADQAGYTAAVDLWSAGVVVYALLTGRPPFQHQVDPATGRRHKTRIDYSTAIDWSPPKNPRTMTPVHGAGTDVSNSVAAAISGGIAASRSFNQRHGTVLAGTRRSPSASTSAAAASFYSAEAKEVVRMLLQTAPQNRATAREALQHRWFDPIREASSGEPEPKPQMFEEPFGLGEKRKR